MTVLRIFGPIILLSAACIGWGVVVLWLLRHHLVRFPLWLHAVVAYFLGQGLLAVIFTFAAIWGWFGYGLVLACVGVGVVVCVLGGLACWNSLVATVVAPVRLWLAEVWPWK